MKTRQWLLMILALLWLAPMVSARIIYVDANANGLNHGGSWGNAYTEITNAVSHAQSGDSIYVANGVYHDFAHGMGVGAGISIYGGFAGESDPSLRQGIYDPQPSPGTVFRFHLYLNNGTRLDGVTILDEYVETDEDVVIANCQFDNGTTTAFTRDIFGDLSDPSGACIHISGDYQRVTIFNSTLSNSANGVPAVFCEYINDQGHVENNRNGTLEVLYCIFKNCRGGAIGANHIKLLMSNTLVTGCGNEDPSSSAYGRSYAGAVARLGAGSQIVNCTISGNSGLDCGGIEMGYYSSPPALIVNTILWNNRTTRTTGPYANALYNNFRSEEYFSYTFHNILIEEAEWVDGVAGSFSQDPRFSEGTFELSVASPCINAGIESGGDIVVPELDIKGRPRFGRPDIGAFEHQGVATPIFTPDGGAHPGSSVQVKVICATAGATIRYTTNGSEPTEASATVAAGGTVAVPNPGTLKAKAWKSGVNPSDTKSASYTVALRPGVTTTTATSITATSATLNGTVNPNGITTTAQFEYGLTTAYGSTASVALSPADGTTAQTVSAIISGLRAGRTYHYRLTATNSSGTNTGADRTLATIPPGPAITVQQPTGTGLKNGSTRSFGSVALKSTATKTFVIRNTGRAKLKKIAIQKGGSHSKDFIVIGPAKKSLAPGASTKFKVTFHPTSKGSRKAAIRIESNDADESPFVIKLSGKGAK